MKPMEGSKGSGRFPPGLVLVGGPVMGLLYVIAFPFISIGTLVYLITKKVLITLFHLIRGIAAFGWRPMEAYLSGRKKRK